MAKKTGLGKGLDALFSTPVVEEQDENEDLIMLLMPMMLKD